MENEPIEKPLTFEELVQQESIRIFDGLLQGGGPEFKQAVRIALDKAVQWRVQCDKYEKQQKKFISIFNNNKKKKLCPICEEKPAVTARGLCRTCSGQGY